MKIHLRVRPFLPHAEDFYLLDLSQVNQSLNHNLVEEESIHLKIVNILLLVAMDGDVAHYLNRLVHLIHLTIYLVHTPVGVAVNPTTYHRVQRA